MTENNKPMTFIQWWNDPNEYNKVKNGFSLEDAEMLWNAARRNMIPAENAIVVPDVGEWPEDADYFVGAFSRIARAVIGNMNDHNPFKFTTIIPRPVPAWTPKDLEPVIFAKPEDDTTLLGIFYKGEILFGYLRYSFRGMRCRPFRESAIGLPWEKI